eukprot:TRINITY_DN11421_c0_g1_i2.p1 TRINITY_DN11421_c0_g1~~TRINITY_DN11421_c0_g1_i2.p1  ORF type:complete len:180 (+),score=37.40 TRINITY_DN11421_c0_g1_i2:36-542(+)
MDYEERTSTLLKDVLRLQSDVNEIFSTSATTPCESHSDDVRTKFRDELDALEKRTKILHQEVRLLPPVEKEQFNPRVKEISNTLKSIRSILHPPNTSASQAVDYASLVSRLGDEGCYFPPETEATQVYLITKRFLRRCAKDRRVQVLCVLIALCALVVAILKTHSTSA